MKPKQLATQFRRLSTDERMEFYRLSGAADGMYNWLLRVVTEDSDRIVAELQNRTILHPDQMDVYFTTRQMRQEKGLSFGQIAKALKAKGHCSSRTGEPFSPAAVRAYCNRWDIKKRRGDYR